MPTYTDQFFVIDPYSPPPNGTAMTYRVWDITDVNGDGDFDRFDGDNVNGWDITASYPGDVVTINVKGVGNVSYTGVTFYLSNGTQVFTPKDGQVLQNGTLAGTSWVSGQGPLYVPELGPTCFGAGTMIETASGPRPIETIRKGDLVKTRDHGLRPVLWLARRRHAATGSAAPVRLRAGALGNRRDLVVSQQHRMLVSGWRAELYLGVGEALVAAKHLVNGHSIVLEEGGKVDYYHLLFDAHELVWAEGLLTESFHPVHALEIGDRALICELSRRFPAMLKQAGRGWSTAGQVARRYEGALLAA